MKNFKQLQKKANQLVNRLTEKAKKRIYENYGQKEVRKFQDTPDFQNLHYTEKCEVNEILFTVSKIGG